MKVFLLIVTVFGSNNVVVPNIPTKEACNKTAYDIANLMKFDKKKAYFNCIPYETVLIGN